MRVPAHRRPLVAALALTLLLSGGGCARRTFSVRAVEPVPGDRIAPQVVSGRLGVRFAPMWDEDWQLDTLDANATMAGVVPVRTEIENRSGDVVRLRRVRFSATDATGRTYRLLDAKKARKRLEKFYGVRLRSKEGDRLYKADFDANVVDLKSDLAPGSRRQGLLFFELPADVRRPVALTVTAADERK